MIFRGALCLKVDLEIAFRHQSSWGGSLEADTTMHKWCECGGAAELRTSYNHRMRGLAIGGAEAYGFVRR